MTGPSANPYSWSSPRPAHIITRPETSDLADRLKRGQTLLLHAGRGMGKSVLLYGLVDHLRRDAPNYTVALIDKGEDLTAAILHALNCPRGANFADSLEGHLKDEQRVILLIDELDAWVRPEFRTTTRATLEQLAKLSRETHPGQLGVLVAGGVGHTLLAHSPWGSTFASRVERTYFLVPFDEVQLAALAAPLAERRALPDGWLRELHLASGGIPALACQMLQTAWTDDELWPLDHLSHWIVSQDGFRRAVRSSISVDEIQGPWRLLQAIHQATNGELRADVANDAVGESLSPENALRVLVSAGLVHRDYDIDADPWLVRPNLSVLELGFPRNPRPSSRLAALHSDLRQACAELRRHASDLFHGRATKRTLVEEATISAMLAMVLRSRGWEVDREPNQGPGRVDLRVHHRDLAGHVVVEVKIWGRNTDRLRAVSNQVAGYALAATLRDRPTLALVAIIIAETTVNWRDFERSIDGVGPRVEDKVDEWQGEATIHDGSKVPLHHILVGGLRPPR